MQLVHNVVGRNNNDADWLLYANNFLVSILLRVFCVTVLDKDLAFCVHINLVLDWVDAF